MALPKMNPSNSHGVESLRSASATQCRGVTQGVGEVFVLFWAIQRTMEKAEANLELVFPAVHFDASVTLPGKKRAGAVDASVVENTTPPVLTNPSPVEAQTRLVALDDLSLHKLT